MPAGPYESCLLPYESCLRGLLPYESCLLPYESSLLPYESCLLSYESCLLPAVCRYRRRAGEAMKATGAAAEEEEPLRPVTRLDFEVALTHVRPGTSQADNYQQVRGRGRGWQ